MLGNNKDLVIKIRDEIVARASNFEIGREQYWHLFGQIELEKSSYDFQIYNKDSRISMINPDDMVLRASNLSEPIVTPKLEFTKINPTKYIVNVHRANEPFPLIFSESFHPGWKIYVQSELAGQETGKFVSENNQGTIQNENLDGGKFYDVLFKKPVLGDSHFQVNGFANAWWVDIEELERQGVIEKNEDGGYNFSIIIEFEPQKYFYIGLLISGITLIGCIGYLGYDWRRRGLIENRNQLIENRVGEIPDS